MDGREGGYIKLFRSIESSEDFIALRADQCWVAVRLIQLANFKAAVLPVRCGSHQHAVRIERGELAHSLETIARRTNSTPKVVRTTVNRLIESGFLVARYPEISGTPLGTPIRVLRVVNYERFNPTSDEAGTPPGMPRAHHGHATGTPRAPSKEGEEGEEGKALRSYSFAARVEETCPNVVALLKRTAEAGFDIDLPVRNMPAIGGAEALVRQAGVDVASAACVEAAKRRNGGHVIPLAYLMGPLRDAVAKGSASSAPRGRQLGTDFTKTLEDLG